MTNRLKFLADRSLSCRHGESDLLAHLSPIMEKSPFGLGRGPGKITYFFHNEVDHVVSTSLRSLVALLRKRYEAKPTPPYLTSVPLDTTKADRDVLRRDLCTEDLSSRPLERRVADDAICNNPHLDAGILAGWFLQNGNASKLLWTIKRLYLKAIGQDIKHGGKTDFTYLTHLCLVTHLKNTKDLLKQGHVRGLPYEKLDQAVGQVIYSAMKEIHVDIFDEIRYKDLAFDVTELECLVKGTTNPLIFVAIHPTLLHNDLNPYHLDQETFELLQIQCRDLEIHIPEVDQSLQSLLDRVKKHKRLREKLLELWSINRFRELVFRYLKDFEDYRGGTNRWLCYLFRNNNLIRGALTEEEAADRLLNDLGGLLSEATGPQQSARIARIAAIENFVKSHGKGGVFKKLLFGSREEEHVKQVIESFLLYQLDMSWTTQVEGCLHHLEDRKILKTNEELNEEYSRGLICRLAADAHPILRDLTIKKEGHLFMDLRGFTQRLATRKEIAMADFMWRDFFIPVLETAKLYCTNEGVRLNNLLGDALAFSGRIETLVSLAQKLRQIFTSYTQKIRRHRGLLSETNEGKTIEQQYQRKKGAIARQRKAADESIAAVEQRLKMKESLNPLYLLKIQEEDFVAKLLRYQREIIGLTKKIDKEQDPDRKRVLTDLKKNFVMLREEVSEQKKLLAESLGCVGRNELLEIFRLICSEEREELERLRKLSKQLHDKELDLHRAYRKELASLSDDELEYGLFISYGDAAETITLEDEFWGKFTIAIADKLNEAARGAARSRAIRKKLELLLRNARWAMGNPNLEYPFHIFIDQSYAVSLHSDLSTKLNRALQHRDVETMQDIVDTMSSLLQHDIEKGMNGIGYEEGWEVLTPLNEIYNLGDAISGEALQAYLTETSPSRYHFQKRVTIDELHPDIRKNCFFPEDELTITVSVQKADDRLQFDVFNHIGELVFKGFETEKPTAVCEIVRKGSLFYQLLHEHHLQAWYTEARDSSKSVRIASK